MEILAVDFPGEVGNEGRIVRLISGAMIVIKGARWILTFFGHMPPIIYP